MDTRLALGARFLGCAAIFLPFLVFLALAFFGLDARGDRDLDRDLDRECDRDRDLDRRDLDRDRDRDLDRRDREREDLPAERPEFWGATKAEFASDGSKP